MKVWQKGVLVLALGLIGLWAYGSGYLDGLIALYDTDALVAFVNSMGGYAYLVFILIYVLGGIIIFPGSILAVSGGILFGPHQGTVMVLLGAWASSVVNYLLSRYALHDWMEQRFSRLALFQKIQHHSGKSGIEFLMVIRTSPGLPFSVKNYLCGLTAIPFWEYTIGSFFTLIPGAVMYAYTAGAVVHGSFSKEIIIPMAVAYAGILLVYGVYKLWLRKTHDDETELDATGA